MDQMAMAELIQSELSAAVLNSDKEAIKRFSILISEKISKIDNVENEQEETKSDLKSLIELVKQGFDNTNKRFEELYRYMDRRFEDMQKYMDKRFEQVDRRFEDMNKKFDMMFKFMSLGFSIITILIVVFKFIH